MKRFISLFVFLLLTVSILYAKYSVHIIVTYPGTTKQVFIAGTFNGWDPGNENYKLIQTGTGRQEIILRNIDAGKIEFKFAKGNWEAGESDGRSGGVKNRVYYITHDTVLYVSIAGWADDYTDLSQLPDSARFFAMMGKGFYFLERNLDSSQKYATGIYAIAKKLQSIQMEAFAMDLQGNILAKRGLTQEALNADFKAIELKKQLGNNNNGVGFTYNSIADLYFTDKDEEKAKEYYKMGINLVPESFKGSGVNDVYLNSNNKLGEIYLHENNMDSALFYATKANELGDFKSSQPLILLGDIQQKKGNADSAMGYFKKAESAAILSNKLTFAAQANQRIAELFSSIGFHDSALLYAYRAFDAAMIVKNPFTTVAAGTFLVNLLQKENKLDSAFLYQQKFCRQKTACLIWKKKDKYKQAIIIKK
jgi:tetratricopeptide (TPR) repeat protein